MEVESCLCTKLESENNAISVAKVLQDDGISDKLQSYIGELVSFH